MRLPARPIAAKDSNCGIGLDRLGAEVDPIVDCDGPRGVGNVRAIAGWCDPEVHHRHLVAHFKQELAYHASETPPP